MCLVEKQIRGVVKVKVYVSTLNFGFGPLPDIMRPLDLFPYPAVEVSSGHPADANSWDAISRYARKHNASVIFHNYAPPDPGDLLVNLSNPDPSERDDVIAFLKSRIDLTKELGSDYYSFHGGYRIPYNFGVRSYDPSQRLARGDALQIFVQAVEAVVVHAEACGVHIGVENHVVEKGNEDNLILYGIEDFQILFDTVRSEYLHLHLDVGHLKVSSETMGFDPQAFLREFRDKIMGAHLHENDGVQDLHERFNEDSWFLEEIRQLPKLRYACLETNRQDKEGIARMQRILANSCTVT